MKLKNLWFLTFFFLFISGCSMKKDADTAEAQIPNFHTQLNSGSYVAVYQGSSQDLKKATTEQDFTALLEAISRKLGKFRNSKQVNWNVSYNTWGSYVTLIHKAEYENGPADEKFVYRLEDGEAKLAGYHINSNVLITR